MFRDRSRLDRTSSEARVFFHFVLYSSTTLMADGSLNENVDKSDDHEGNCVKSCLAKCAKYGF